MVISIASLLPELVPLVPLWGQWFAAIAPLLPVLIQLAAVLLQALIPVIRIAIIIVVKYWTTIFSLLIPVFKLLVTVITWVAQILTPIIQFIGWLIRGIGTAAMFIWNIIKIAFAGIVLAGKILAALIFVFVVAPLLIAFNLVKAAAIFLWQNVFVPVWNGIQWAARKAWVLLQPVFSALAAAARTVGGWFTWLYRYAIVPAWNGIKNTINWAWGIIKTVFNVIVAVIRVTLAPVFRWLYNNVIKPVWSWIGAHIRSVWNTLIKPTFDTLKSAIGHVRDAFKTAVDAIGRIWDGLKSKTKGPVQFVVNTVYTKGIKKAWDTVAGLVKLPKLPDLKFAEGGVVPAGAYGVLPGYAPGRDTMLAAVSPGEAWIRPDATRALGPSFIHGLNSAAVAGGTGGAARFLSNWQGPAFGLGGIVGDIGDKVKKAKNFVVHGASSLLANGASALVSKILKPIVSKIPAGTSPWTEAMARLPKQMIDNFISWVKKAIDPKLMGSGDGGKAVAYAIKQLGKPYVWGATGPNSFDCSGLTMRAWQAAGKNIGRTTYDQVKSGRPGSRGSAKPGDLHFPHPGHVMMFVKPGSGGDQEMIHAPHTGDVVRYAGFRGGGKIRLIATGSSGGSTQSASKARAYAKSQLGEFGWSGGQYDPLNRLWIRESNWRWNAQNPSSGAYGIPQALPGSKMASAGSDWRTNGITQVRWGLGYIKGRYGSPAAAWGHSQRTGWYDNGGYLPPGITTVLNGTGKPEVVLTDAQWRSISAAAQGGDGGVQYHAHFDGMTKAAYEQQVRAGIQAEAVLAAQKDRTGRRR
jgi:cell wall-associated NlpC family hydrolase